MCKLKQIFDFTRFRSAPITRAAMGLLGFAMMLLLVSASQADGVDEVWLLVDTTDSSLSILEGDQILETYRNISVGRRGTTLDKITRDKKTPLGEYRVVRISDSSTFHRFIGLDYPTPDQAERALKKGIITFDQYAAIHRAFEEGRTPPQNTPLGGYIGIHGIGEGDPWVHGSFNWTNGCIALTNEQVDNLQDRIAMGMKVVIR